MEIYPLYFRCRNQHIRFLLPMIFFAQSLKKLFLKSMKAIRISQHLLSSFLLKKDNQQCNHNYSPDYLSE